MLTLALGFLFGCFIGSFLNVCVHRLPRNESIVLPPSRCYACGTMVRWYDNLPIISYLLLRGRCRWCGTGFSPRYLIMEVVVGLATALVLWRACDPASHWQAPWLGQLVDHPWGLTVACAAAGAAVLTLMWLLIVASAIDLDYLIIPDELTVTFQLAAPFLATLTMVPVALNVADPGLWSPLSWVLQTRLVGAPVLTPDVLLAWCWGIGGGCIALLFLSLPVARRIYSHIPDDSERWSEAEHRGFAVGVKWFIGCTLVHLLALSGLVLAQVDVVILWVAAQALLGSLTGWMSLYLIGLVGTVVFRRNAMGFGDVKFLAPVGAFLGPLGVVYTFFAAAVAGTLVGLPLRLMKNQVLIPFGPYLALGAVLVLFLGPWLHGVLFVRPG